MRSLGLTWPGCAVHLILGIPGLVGPEASLTRLSMVLLIREERLIRLLVWRYPPWDSLRIKICVGIQ